MDKIKADYRFTSAQLGSGEYSSNLDSRQQEASGVNLGVRWQF